MKGNFQVRFLGEGDPVTGLSYPARKSSYLGLVDCGQKIVPNDVPMREASVLLVVIKRTPTFGDPLQIGLTRCICEYFTKSL
jgi:hypothetical protein